MIRRLLRRLIRGYESTLGVDLPYLDDVTTHRPGALLPLAGLALGGRFGRRMPSDALLSPGVRAAFRFGQALALGLDAEEERARIRSEWGESALVEASVAAAYAVTFPIVKRGMGHAHACDVRQLRLER